MERIIETKFYDLDLKVTEIQTTVEQLQEEAEERRGKATTVAFERVCRGQRSAAVPVRDSRATTSAPAATAPAATPPAPTTSTDAFVLEDRDAEDQSRRCVDLYMGSPILATGKCSGFFGIVPGRF